MDYSYSYHRERERGKKEKVAEGRSGRNVIDGREGGRSGSERDGFQVCTVQ